MIAVRPCSFRLEPGYLRELRPFLQLCRHEFAKLIRAVSNRLKTARDQKLLRLRRLDRLADFRLEPCDDPLYGTCINVVPARTLNSSPAMC